MYTQLSIERGVFILATILHHQHHNGLGAVCARHDNPCSMFFIKLQQVTAVLARLSVLP